VKNHGRSWKKITFGTLFSLMGMIVLGDSVAMDRNFPHFNIHKTPAQTEQASENNQQDPTTLLLTKLEDLQRQLQQLRGEMEIQSHELKHLQQQQVNFDTFQKKYESNSKPGLNSLSVTTENKTNHEPQSESLNLEVPKSLLIRIDEESSYDAAYQLVQQRQFKQAIPAMQQYLAAFPHGLYTANAIYWLGELYLAEGAPRQALDQFNMIVNQYPDSNKVGPSMLKIGFAYQMLGDLNKANQQLKKVKQEFPNSSVAQLATVRLQQMT